MDFKTPVVTEDITARQVTDTHRRALASCAAFTFARHAKRVREEIEDPMRNSEPAAKPASKIEGVADDDQPLSTKDRDECLGLISELKFDPEKKKPTPEKLESFLKAFRRDFGLGKNESVAPAFTSVKHQTWLQVNLPKYV